jgi:DNA-binding HxlR family transcriptional regulator
LQPVSRKLELALSREVKVMKRKCLAKAECAVARALDAIGDWWSLLIIRDAFFGRRRFGEFQKSLGLARNILTARLRKLVDRGVLEMVPASDGSAYQEYVLTEKGRGLDVVLIALRQWGESFLYERGEACRTKDGDAEDDAGARIVTAKVRVVEQV